MKTPLKLLTLILLTFSLLANAQNSIPNAGFENWSTVTYDELDNYLSETGFTYFILGSSTTSKSTDAQNGNFSVRMETKTNGTDTVFGFFTSGDFDKDNGYPYSQQPDSLVGYYKSNIAVGDSGFIVIRFSRLGTIFSFNVQPFTNAGNTNSWTRFAMPLNVPLVPDSMFVAAVSSNAINEIGVTPGSWLMLDNLSLVGTNITQGILNGNFENWTTVSIENPDDWSSINLYSNTAGVLSATKSTDKHAGNFALKLETVVVRDDTLGFITNGTFGNDSIIGGQPFSVIFDTLSGYYKYSPVGLDTAGISLTFWRGANPLGVFFNQFLPASTYTPFEVPFVLPQVPDTLRIDIISSLVDNRVGSSLFIDNLILKSIVTSLDEKNELANEVQLYPNPVRDHLSISMQLSNTSNVSIINAIGSEFWRKEKVSKGEFNHKIDCSHLSTGTYFLRVESGSTSTHYKILKH